MKEVAEIIKVIANFITILGILGLFLAFFRYRKDFQLKRIELIKNLYNELNNHELSDLYEKLENESLNNLNDSKNFSYPLNILLNNIDILYYYDSLKLIKKEDSDSFLDILYILTKNKGVKEYIKYAHEGYPDKISTIGSGLERLSKKYLTTIAD